MTPDSFTRSSLCSSSQSRLSSSTVSAFLEARVSDRAHKIESFQFIRNGRISNLCRYIRFAEQVLEDYKVITFVQNKTLETVNSNHKTSLVTSISTMQPYSRQGKKAEGSLSCRQTSKPRTLPFLHSSTGGLWQCILHFVRLLGILLQQLASQGAILKLELLRSPYGLSSLERLWLLP